MTRPSSDAHLQSGGAIGLAIGNSVLNNIFLANLPKDLTNAEQESLLGSLDAAVNFPSDMQNSIYDACRLLTFFYAHVPGRFKLSSIIMQI